MPSFAERLKALRAERGITQEDLAAAVGVSRSTIGGYEAPSKEREPEFDLVCRLAAFFRVSTDYLLGLSDNHAPPSRQDDTGIDTLAAHRDDDPMSDLPDAARKSVDDFIAYIRQKYSKKNN